MKGNCHGIVVRPAVISGLNYEWEGRPEARIRIEYIRESIVVVDITEGIREP